jgi:hypothetical protein
MIMLSGYDETIPDWGVGDAEASTVELPSLGEWEVRMDWLIFG